MIYFIQQGLRGPIKIGVTDAVAIHRRMNSLQTGNPYPLRLVGTARGNTDEERKLHRKFKADRLNGEWFKATEALCNFANTRNMLSYMQKAIPFDAKAEDMLKDESDKVREAMCYVANTLNILPKLQKAKPVDAKNEDAVRDESDKVREAAEQNVIKWMQVDLRSQERRVKFQHDILKEELECIKIKRAKLLYGKEEKQIEQLTFAKCRAESQLDKARKNYTRLQEE